MYEGSTFARDPKADYELFKPAKLGERDSTFLNRVYAEDEKS